MSWHTHKPFIIKESGRQVSRQQQLEQADSKTKSKTKTTAGRRRKLIINQRNAGERRSSCSRSWGRRSRWSCCCCRGSVRSGSSRRIASRSSRKQRCGVIYAPTTAKANESHILTLCQDGRRGPRASRNQASVHCKKFECKIKVIFVYPGCVKHRFLCNPLLHFVAKLTKKLYILFISKKY